MTWKSGFGWNIKELHDLRRVYGEWLREVHSESFARRDRRLHEVAEFLAWIELAFKPKEKTENGPAAGRERPSKSLEVGSTPTGAA